MFAGSAPYAGFIATRCATQAGSGSRGAAHTCPPLRRMTQALLSASALSVGRGDRVLIDGLCLDVAAGEVVHLRGRNGVGKTSLLEVLAGLRPALSGTVAREALHWLGHRNGLTPSLSVLQNLQFWCGLNGAAEARISPALERLGLYRLRHRDARTLSAGQKRRSALARLLVSPRPLWLLDEPLSGLDAGGLALFGELMQAHVARGGAALVTSHQPLPVVAVALRSVDL